MTCGGVETGAAGDGKTVRGQKAWSNRKRWFYTKRSSRKMKGEEVWRCGGDGEKKTEKKTKSSVFVCALRVFPQMKVFLLEEKTI